MRLLHVSNYHSPYPGSFIPMLRAALRLGLERGLRPEAVFLEGAEERPWVADLEADGIPVRFVRAGELARVLEDGDGEPAILHVHFALLQLEAARAAREHPGTRLFWHVHTTVAPGPYAWLRNAVRFRWLARDVDEILCVSPHLATALRRRLAPAARVVAFPNGIDLDRFRPAGPDERRAARERLGVPPDVPVTAHFGRDWRLKGGDVYEEAARRLRAGPRPELVALSVGAGPEAGEAVRRTEPAARVEDVYAAADVFVSSSRAEGGAPPFAVAESLACGTAVAASDIAGQRELGGHLDAVRVAPLRAEPLADAIEGLLARDPARVEADAAQARAWLERHMDVRMWAERLFERYAQAGALPT